MGFLVFGFVWFFFISPIEMSLPDADITLVLLRSGCLPYREAVVLELSVSAFLGWLVSSLLFLLSVHRRIGFEDID